MRWLPLVTVLLLAGCAAPEEEEQDNLVGLCPQWMQAGGAQTGGLRINDNGTARIELGPVNATHRNLPLDLFRVQIVSFDGDGILRLRATDANGNRLSLRDYRADNLQVLPVVVVDAAAVGHDFDIMLSPLLQDVPPAPLPASLNLTLEGSTAFVEYAVTYHYKVCGI